MKSSPNPSGSSLDEKIGTVTTSMRVIVYGKKNYSIQGTKGQYLLLNIQKVMVVFSYKHWIQ